MHRVEDGIGDPDMHPLGTEVTWQTAEPPDPSQFPNGKSVRYRGNEAQGRTPDIQPIGGGRTFQNWTEERLGEDDSRPLKELPFPIGWKREIRRKQERCIIMKTSWESWKEEKRRSARQFRSKASETLQYVEVWRSTLQTIGGHFGTGIQSYFSFLRFLVLMNLVTFLLVGGFIVIPNILFEALNLEPSASTSHSQVLGNRTCLNYNPNPQGLERYYTFIMDILMGTGFMELTYMFYGFYKNTAVNLTAFSYNIPLAYLTTTLLYFLLILVWTVIRSVRGFKQSLLNEDASLSNYSNKVFAGWDFCMSDQNIIQLKQKGIRYELKVDLEEEKMARKHAERTMSQRAGIYILRIFLNLFILCLIGGAFYCIYLSTLVSQELLTENSVKGNFFLELLVGYLPSIVITAANFILPAIFSILIKWEKYTLSWEIRLTLIRCVFLRFASLGMLLYSLWNQITCDGNPDENKCKHCGYNSDVYQCWETRVGQEMYKLMIFDFLTVLVVILLVDFPRKMMIDHCSCKLIHLWGQQEFLVPQYVLDIIYGQTVCWIGTFFSPMLPLLNTVKYFIIFYMKRLTLTTNCRPADRTFRASSANFFFLLVLLLGLALSWVPILYSIFVITPSKACGPFRGQASIWSTIPTTIQTLPTVAQDFFLFIGSQAFAVPFFCFTCVIMVFLIALGNSYGKLVKELKKQLQMEGTDKHFLVKQITRLSKANN